MWIDNPIWVTRGPRIVASSVECLAGWATADYIFNECHVNQGEWQTAVSYSVHTTRGLAKALYGFPTLP